MPAPAHASLPPLAGRADAIVHLSLFAVQATFSGLHIFGKVVLESVHPLALASMRVLFAAPVLLALAWRHDRTLPKARDLPILALLGLLGVFLNQILFIFGLRATTATNAAILMTSIPVFAVAAGAALKIERIGIRRIQGVTLAVVGSLVLLGPGRFELGEGTTFGNLLVLLNCLSFAFFLVLQRPVLARLPWRTVLAWAFVFGGAGVVAVGGGELRALAAQPSAVPALAWVGVGYILLFPTVIAYTLNTWAVRRSSPSVVATYTTLQPLLTALAALPLLGEALGWPQAAGFLLIAGGLLRVSRRRDPIARR